MDITRWPTLKSDYFLCSQRWRSSLQSAKIRLGANCGSDHELLIAKFRLKLKKGGKTTRPFRYDLNRIPCDYIVEAINWFKRLDLVDRVPEELWTDVHNIVQEVVSKTIPNKNKCQKAKWLSEEVFQQLKIEKWKAREKGKDISIWMQSFKEEQWEIRKASKWTMQWKSKPIEWKRLEISSRKLEIPREYIVQGWVR